MADKEEWEEMKQEACMSPLGPPPSCDSHSLFFTEQKKKRGIFVCLRARVCLTSYPHKRFVFSLHYLSFLSSEQFYFQLII